MDLADPDVFGASPANSNLVLQVADVDIPE
jgi:hypothetical protein